MSIILEYIRTKGYGGGICYSINGNIKPRLDTLIYNPIKDFRHIVD